VACQKDQNKKREGGKRSPWSKKKRGIVSKGGLLYLEGGAQKRERGPRGQLRKNNTFFVGKNGKKFGSGGAQPGQLDINGKPIKKF